MSDDEAGVPLRAVIGEGVRAVRTRAGVRQEDVSRAARRWGLNWSRARVWTLETGAKAISAEELILLPLVMSDACGREVTLPELIDWSPVELSPIASAHSMVVCDILAGRSVLRAAPEEISPLPLGAGAVSRPSVGPAESTGEAMRRIAALSHRLRELLPAPDDPRARSQLLFRGAPSEVDRAAARRLNEDARVVLAVSRFLWNGRALGEERDARVAARSDAGSDPERLRALRGRETRALVDQLRDYFERHPTTAGGGEERDAIFDAMTLDETDRAYAQVLRERMHPELGVADDPDVAAAFEQSADVEEER